MAAGAGGKFESFPLKKRPETLFRCLGLATLKSAPALKLGAICTGIEQKRVALQQRPSETGRTRAKTGFWAQIPYCFCAAKAGS
jgi:hypothetical protein